MNNKEISIILPCLNEEQGVGFCIDKIKEIIKKNKLNAEILVVDNGSTDKSYEIIKEKKAIFLMEKKKGYGNAYLKGIKYAKGKFIILADSDGSYDFSEIPRFLKYLNDYDFVIGNRFNKKMKKRAMPFTHRYMGNPIIRFLLKMHGLNLKEVCTGFIGIKKSCLIKMDLKSSGMEFSSEILVKAKKLNLRIKEIPITYYKRYGKSKLHPIRDGLRHTGFLLKTMYDKSLR